MGEIIIRKVRGMSMMAKISLVLIFTLMFSTFMYHGWYKPKKSEAAITSLNAWSNIYSSTARPAASITYDVPAATYPNTRMLVVGVSSAIGTASTAQTCTVSYGGQSLTAVASNFTTSSRFHTALFYLLDSGIQAATNNQLTVTLSAQGTQWTAQVDAAVFEGVAQSAPASNQSWLNNGTASATVGPFGTALTIGTGELAVEAVAITRTSSATPRTIGTWAANWSGAIGPTTVGTATTGSTNFYMAQDSTAGNTTSQHTASNTTNGSMSAMSIPMLAMNLTVGNGQALGTLYAGQGTINNVLDSFTMVASAGGVTVNTLTLTGSANFTTANISNVSVYRDNGTLGVFDASDVLVPSTYSAITGGVTTITFTTPETALTTAENFLVIVDIAAGSATTGTFTGTITAATGSIGTPTYSDSSSATQTLTASPGLTIGNGTDPASDSAGQDTRENELDAFTLAVAAANRGSAGLDSVTFTGTNFTTANISGVKVFRSDGTLVPSTYSAIAGNATTITFTQHEMVTSTTPQSYTVKVDIASGATVGNTITGNISAAAGHGLGTPTDNDSASATLTIKAYAHKTTSCYQCHGYLSLFPDGTTRNTPAGTFTGEHQPHVEKFGAVCSVCHVVPATVTSADYDHRDGEISMQSSISGGTYSRGTTFPQSNSPATGTCSNISCHGGNSPTGNWGTGTAACIACHNGVITRTKGVPGGTLDNVVAEFRLTWGHKSGANGSKTDRGAVTDADCIVCHIEGNYQTQKTSVYHADGNIDLRDPDNITNGESPIKNISGGAFTFQKFSVSYAAGSRTATSHQSDTDVANVITQKFCLGCHDSAGAANTTARSGAGTNAMPFGGIALGATYTATNGAIGTQGLIDVKTQTLATNSSFHPLQGPRNTAYPLPSRLAFPYNNIGTGRDSNTSLSTSPRNKANSVVMNCFDCHTTGTSLTNRTTAAHGAASSLRGTVFVTSPTLCSACHVGYLTAPGTTSTHGAGSAMASSTGQTTTMATVCHNCHFSNQADPGRPVRAFDVHGFNGLLATGNAWTYGNGNGMRPRAFIRNTGWATISPRPYTAPGLTITGANCGGNAAIGTVCSANNHSGYTPGGAY